MSRCSHMHRTPVETTHTTFIASAAPPDAAESLEANSSAAVRGLTGARRGSNATFGGSKLVHSKCNHAKAALQRLVTQGSSVRRHTHLSRTASKRPTRFSEPPFGLPPLTAGESVCFDPVIFGIAKKHGKQGSRHGDENQR